MGSGQWSVGSGQWAVVSIQWAVGDGEIPLIGEMSEGQKGLGISRTFDVPFIRVAKRHLSLGPWPWALGPTFPLAKLALVC